MTNAVREWVVYHPPKSAAFGHHCKPRDPRLAWPKVEQFLGGLADVELGHVIELTCFGPGEWTDAAVAARRIEEARFLFGSEMEPSQPHPRWKIDESRVASAIEFALDDDKFPKQQMGPVRFHCYYRFLWTEFEQLPYWVAEGETRKRKSHLGVTVGSRILFLQPTFVFPAPWNSEFLRDFITRVSEVVPFRFREQYFKRSIPTKRGGYGRLLNLPKNWREPIILAGSREP